MGTNQMKTYLPFRIGMCAQRQEHQQAKKHWEGLEKSKDTEHGQQSEIEQDIFWRGRKHR